MAAGALKILSTRPDMIASRGPEYREGSKESRGEGGSMAGSCDHTEGIPTFFFGGGWADEDGLSEVREEDKDHTLYRGDEMGGVTLSHLGREGGREK